MSDTLSGTNTEIQNGTDIVSNLLHVVNQGTRGGRHGLEEWQYHHCKVNDATTKVEKEDTSHSRKDGTMTLQIKKPNRDLDGPIFWVYFKTVEFEFKMTWDDRNCYKDHVFRWNQSFITKAASTLAVSQHQEEIGNVLSPPSDIFRHKQISDQLLLEVRWQSPKRRTITGSQTTSTSSTTCWERQRW